MPFLDSTTGLDSEVSEEKMKKLTKIQVKQYFPIYGGCSWDPMKLQWTANGNEQEEERPAFNVTRGKNLNTPSTNSGQEPLTKVENSQDINPHT